MQRNREIQLTSGWRACWSYNAQGRSLGFGHAAPSDDEELRVELINWQTEMQTGGAGSGASSCPSHKPGYGFATRVRVMDHGMDLTARRMGTTGGRSG